MISAVALAGNVDLPRAFTGICFELRIVYEGAMKRPIPLATAVYFLAASSVGIAAGPLNINHEPVRCVSSTRRPVVDANVVPQNEIERGSVYFREKGSKDFYYVIMKPWPLDVAGELPRRLAGMNGMEYYVEVTNVARVPAKSSQYVAGFDPACSDPRASTNIDGLTIGLTRNCQNPVPPGFNKEDICNVILASGATVGLADAERDYKSCVVAAAGAAGAGAGISTGALVAGGVVVAVVGGLVIANNTGGGGGDTVSPSRPARSNR